METLKTRLFFHSENYRLKSHFLRIEQKLRRNQKENLSSIQSENRQKKFNRISRYRQQGKFPMNTDHPNQMMPYFRDKFGTLCAVADLVDQTAGPDIVNYFVAKDNNFLVNETNDLVLNKWSD